MKIFRYLNKETAEKHGNLQMARNSFYVENTTVEELLHIMWCKNYRETVQPLLSYEAAFNYIGVNSNVKEPAYAQTRGELNYGKLMQSRENLMVYSGFVDTNNKAIVLVSKSFYAPHIPVQRNCIRSTFFGCIIMEQLENRVRYSQVQNLAQKGWTLTAHDEYLMKAWCTTSFKLLNDAAQMYRKLVPVPETNGVEFEGPLPGFVDDLKLIQTCVDNKKNGISINVKTIL